MRKEVGGLDKLRKLCSTPWREESVTITRNNTVLGTISPPERAVTLRDAFERIPKMPPDVADRYMADIRNADFDDEVRDPWQK
jgi:hypothetical protein